MPSGRTSFPPELIDEIISNVSNDKNTLLSCSLASHHFLPASQRHLFRRIQVNGTNSSDRFLAFGNFLAEKPGMIECVQELKLYGGMITRYDPTITSSSVKSIIAALPSLHTLELVGLGWKHDSRTNKNENSSPPPPPRRLRSLFLSFITFQNSRDQAFLDILSLFSEVDSLSINNIWTVKNDHDQEYDTVLANVQKYRVDSSIPWNTFRTPRLAIQHTGAPRVEFFMEVLRNTLTPSILQTLKISLSSTSNALAFRAFIPDCSATLRSLKMQFIERYDDHDELGLGAGAYTFDLSSCKALTNLHFHFTLDNPEIAEGITQSLSILSKFSPAPPLQNLRFTLVVDQDPLSEEDELIELLSENVDWDRLDSLLAGGNFGSLESVVVVLSYLRQFFFGDESESFVSSLQESVEGLERVREKGWLKVLVDEEDEVQGGDI